jgi:C-terminal processing protease CtpA/Prc
MVAFNRTLIHSGVTHSGVSATGLMIGDEIVEVDGLDVSRKGLQEVEALLIGTPGEYQSMLRHSVRTTSERNK